MTGFYRKKAILIEAQQLTDAVLDAEHPSDEHIVGVNYDPDRRCATIDTLEGQMTAEVGDWIIRGIKGELYPCKPDIFQETYVQVAGVRNV
jgi:hypothetical protein